MLLGELHLQELMLQHELLLWGGRHHGHHLLPRLSQLLHLLCFAAFTWLRW
jgi:hypothetical protein